MGSPGGKLRRVLGVGFGLAVTVGGAIGLGILSEPGKVADRLPHAGWFLGVWVAGGLFALLAALSVAELGAMVPQSGGFYVFARRAFGPYAGFLAGWSDWLGTCGTTAAVAIAVGEYTKGLIPALAGQAVFVALAAAVLFLVLQWPGSRWGGRAQEVTSLLKALGFLALVAACFWQVGPGALAAPAGRAVPTGWAGLAAVVLALQGVIYTYDGWYNPIYFAEELRDPGRGLPRAMVGGVLSVIAIYLLVNLTVLAVVPWPQLAKSPLAVGTAAGVVFGDRGETVARVVATVSLLGAVNANQLIAPRILYAMSRDGLFSRHAVWVNPGGTPTVALLASTLAAVAFILTGTFDQVIAVLAFFFVVNYTLALLAVFVLRRREPQTPRPYRAWGYPWTTALVLAGALAFLAGTVASDPRNSLTALALLAFSYPAFRLVTFGRRGPAAPGPGAPVA
jgi:APA family basic amino acid/polyamine antiporter